MSIFILLVVGWVTHGPGLSPEHDVKMFRFFDKDSCDRAAVIMDKARDVMVAFCIKVPEG